MIDQFINKDLTTDREPDPVVGLGVESISSRGWCLDIPSPAGGEVSTVDRGCRPSVAIIEVDRRIHPDQPGAGVVLVIPILGEQAHPATNHRRLNRKDFFALRVQIHGHRTRGGSVADDHRYPGGAVCGFAAVLVEP